MSRRNLSNSLWNILDVMMYPALYLLFTPFFIRHMGKELYGLWVLVNTITVFMQIFNFGLGIGTMRNVARCIAVGDRDGVVQVIRTNFTIALVLALTAMAGGVLLALLVSRCSLFGISPVYHDLAFRCIVLAGGIAGFKFLEQVFTNTLNAHERIAAVARYNSFTRLSILFSSIWLISKGQSIFTIMLCNIAIYTMAGLVLFFFARRRVAGLSLRLQWDKALILAELRYSRWIWIQSIFVILAFQCDKFWVAQLIGVASFSYYSIVSTMFNHLHMALAAVVPWAMPQFSKRFAQGRDTNSYYLSVRSMVLLVCYIGILLLSFIYRPLFRLWLGADILSHIDMYLQRFMIFQLFFTFTIVPYFFLNARHEEKFQALNTLVYSLLPIAGMWSGFMITGTMEGFMNGMILTTLLAVIWQQWVINRRILHLSLFREIVIMVLPMLFLGLFILRSDSGTAEKSCYLVLSLLSFACFFYQYPVDLKSIHSNEIQPK